MFLGASGSMVGAISRTGTVRPGGHVVGQGVDGRVVAVDGRQQVVVEPLVRGGRVDVAAPDPPRGAVLAHRDEVADGQRLRVVDDDEVVGTRELGRVGAADVLVEGTRRRREVDRVPLQAVVEALGDVVELGGRREDLPVRLQPDVADQRHQRVQDLGHAAAEGGGVDVQDLTALELLGELVDLGHQVLGDDASVVGQRLAADVHFVHVASVNGWEGSTSHRTRSLNSGVMTPPPPPNAAAAAARRSPRTASSWPAGSSGRPARRPARCSCVTAPAAARRTTS